MIKKIVAFVEVKHREEWLSSSTTRFSYWDVSL